MAVNGFSLVTREWIQIQWRHWIEHHSS